MALTVPAPGVDGTPLAAPARRPEALAARLRRARFAYTVRHVRRESLVRVLAGPGIAPRPGDLVLAQVREVGHHERLELTTSRRSTLFPGDDVVVAYANRYAPDQFEAEIPEDLGRCALVAAGGVASRMLSKHAKARTPTVLDPVGLLADRDGRRANLADWALPPIPRSTRRPLTIAVVGTSMNAGKTTTAAHTIHGLALAGHRVGAAKVTGTGAGGDTWLMADAGAAPVLDFTHAGHPSTYRLPAATVAEVFSLLTDHLAAAGVDVAVLEVADGLFQDETAALLASPVFRDGVDAVLFAAGDALGAVAGVRTLQGQGLPVMGVSGCLTQSPLGAAEAARELDVPVLTLEALRSSEHCTAMLARAAAGRGRAAA